jgi:hypothetical protein
MFTARRRAKTRSNLATSNLEISSNSIDLINRTRHNRLSFLFVCEIAPVPARGHHTMSLQTEKGLASQGHETKVFWHRAGRKRLTPKKEVTFRVEH